MSENPLISIIVPVYKTEKYLNRCVESIINQTYKNLEIILIDDSSPDHCPKMCDDWAVRDERIKVLHIENKGVANARNQGLNIAAGDYIGFVDSDDYIEPEMYEYLIGELKTNPCDIAVCGYQINTEEKGMPGSHIVSAEDALKRIVMGDYKYGVLWNKLYTRQVVQKVAMPHLVCCEDLVYNYYAFRNAQKVVESDFRLYHYVNNASSTTNDSFGEGAFDAVRSKEIILTDGGLYKELIPYAVYGYVMSCFVVMSGVISNQKCLDRYDELRNGILKYKKEILFSKLYSGRVKMKTFVLWLSPKLYNRFIH